MGILEMDFERILGVTFFYSNSHSIILCSGVVQIYCQMGYDVSTIKIQN